MPGFLNLSDTLAAARQRAAHSSENLRSLLSPSPAGSSTSGRGVTFATVGHQMADSLGSSILDVKVYLQVSFLSILRGVRELGTCLCLSSFPSLCHSFV